MNCTNCGKLIDDNVEVCPECGASIIKSEGHEAPSTPTPPSTPFQQVEEAKPSTPTINVIQQPAGNSKNADAALLKYIKGMGTTKLIIAGAIVVVVLIAVISIIAVLSKPKPEKGPGPQQVDTVSTLTKVVKTSSFSTYEVVYNGVCTINNEKKPENVDYYVAYTSTIKAGFDFSEIEISKDDEKKEIVVSLPPVELYGPTVKIEDLDYIIVNKKIKTETISADAYKVCRADVAEKAKNQNAIFKYARENGERLLRGLLTPFIEKMDGDYTIRFEWRDAK